MKHVKYLLVFVIFFASCRATRNAPPFSTPEQANQPVLVGAVSPVTQPSGESISTEKAVALENTIEVNEPLATTEATQAIAAKKVTKKVASFSQFKEMAKSGEIAMSKKDQKTLNKLDKHYKGNFQKFKADAFEFTTKAKIVAGVGLLGLLLAIFAGSAFGWFLFILAVLAFLLRYLDIIAF